MSDKLAQRNLNVVGVASPHLVPYTFDIKPTASELPPSQMPDELMIDWGNVPSGTKASIYLPGLNAQSILTTADRLYSHHDLSRLDEHTLGCKAAGISYIPIPPGIGANHASNHAGLMTIDVPPTVRRGQAFKVVTRQITNTFGLAPEAQAPPEIAAVSRVAATHDVIKWRKVLGSFQVTIPVQTKAVLLEPEQRLLSVLRWISRSIPRDNRWRPVFDRYLEQIAGRVDALGGDSRHLSASSSGDWKAGARCKSWGRFVAALLGVLLASFGSLTGAALAVVLPLVAVFLVVAVAWFKKCHPKSSGWLRTLLAGIGLGAALLAILALVGITAPQLMPVLCVLIVLAAVGYLLGR
jgi:hypothetical protein